MKKYILSGAEEKNVILIRIKPTTDPTKKVENIKGSNFLLDLVFLADQNKRNVLECQHNADQINILMDHFGEQKFFIIYS